jgi:hypothetical protein
MTGPVSSTPRSFPTSKASPQHASGPEPQPGSPASASSANESSPTTAAATSQTTGIEHARPPAPRSPRHDPVDLKPTARSSAITAPSTRMGLHPRLDHRRRTPHRLRRLQPLLQSPPPPRRARLVNPHDHLRHPRGQPPRRTYLEAGENQQAEPEAPGNGQSLPRPCFAAAPPPFVGKRNPPRHRPHADDLLSVCRADSGVRVYRQRRPC